MLDIDKIYCGDNIEVMKGIEDNSVDLTVTSPPYDNLRAYKGYTFNFETTAKELYRITKQGGIVVWVVGDATIKGSETGTSFRQALYFKEIGFAINDTMVWEKRCPKHSYPTRYLSAFEFMFVFSKGIPKTANLIRDRKNKYAGQKIARMQSKRDKKGNLIANSASKLEPDRRFAEYGLRTNIWRWGAGDFIPPDEFVYQHPAIFPEQLARDHILSWSNEGDLVFDPMCGSGTTCKMALRNNRHYLGCDISQEYCDIANKRIEAENAQLKLAL